MGFPGRIGGPQACGQERVLAMVLTTALAMVLNRRPLPWPLTATSQGPWGVRALVAPRLVLGKGLGGLREHRPFSLGPLTFVSGFSLCSQRSFPPS